MIALEGGVVKRAGKATALARGSAAATSPSSATTDSLLGPVALDPNSNSPGRSPIPGSAAGATGGSF